MDPELRLRELRSGSNPRLIIAMKSGFAVMAENQFLTGYCLLLADPLVGQLNDLSLSARAQFFQDMAEIGDAVMAVTGCKRINYALYGNQDPFLHAHIWPRFESEPPDLRTLPPLCFPEEVRMDPQTRFTAESHGQILGSIQKRLAQRAAQPACR